MQDLDRRLIADALFVELHPKFSFAIDGGGKRFSPETDDLALRALQDQASPLFQLFIAGFDTGFAVDHSRAVDCLLEAARACIRLAKQFNVSVRSKKIAAIPGGLDAVIQAVSHYVVPSPSRNPLRVIEEAPLGMYPNRMAAHVTIIPSVPLGRLTSAQASCIGTIALESGADLRLAPWRGIVLGSVPQHLAAGVAAQLGSVGLWCDGRDGFHGIAACAGSTGCDASLADVRADALALAPLSCRPRAQTGLDGKPLRLREAVRHAARCKPRS